MKYDIDKELKSLSIFRGSVVGNLYPLINIGYMLKKDDILNGLYFSKND